MELLLSVRRGESLVVTLAIPVGVLVIFGKIQPVVATGFKTPLEFLVPGVLALAVMANAMVSLGISTGFERRYGVLKRLGSTPLSRGGLIAAKVIDVLVIEVLQIAVLLLTAISLGWNVTIGMIPAVGLLLLGSVAFAGIGILLAGTMRAEANLAVSNGLFFLLMFLGGMAYPLERLPDLLEVVARLLPAGALSESVRGVLVEGREPALGAMAALTGWAVIAPLAAARWFRWEE